MGRRSAARRRSLADLVFAAVAVPVFLDMQAHHRRDMLILVSHSFLPPPFLLLLLACLSFLVSFPFIPQFARNIVRFRSVDVV